MRIPVILPSLVAMALLGCGGSSEDSSTPVVIQSGNSLPPLDEIYSVNQSNALEEIGMLFNPGDDPPNIEGSYLYNNRVTQATSIPGDTKENFVNSTITFSNQDNRALTVEYTSVEDESLNPNSNTSTSISTAALISGTGQSFTVYIISETQIDGVIADTTVTISGVMTDSGIENIQTAPFMLDNKGSSAIPNDTGRLIIDADGLTERLPDTEISTKALVDYNQSGEFKN